MMDQLRRPCHLLIQSHEWLRSGFELPRATVAFVGALLVALATSVPAALAQPALGGAASFDQDSAGVPDQSDAGDRFGWQLTGGDFDGDGFADLAIGAPFEGIYDPMDSGGQVTILRGSDGGIDPLLGAQLWSRGLGLLTGDVALGDELGFALAAGDFDDDGIADLAIGVPWGDVLNGPAVETNAGFVYILWGSGVGLTAIGHLYLHRGAADIPGDPEAGDDLGYALTVGDFNGDEVDDLAIGLPLYRINEPPAAPINAAGALTVVYGSASGLSASPAPGVDGHLWTKPDIGQVPHELDSFGRVLAAGDFDADGFDDLAVGSPLEESNPPGATEAGAVYVIRGSATGLTASGARHFHRGMTAFWGNPAANDAFGASLAAADFDGDGAAELVIGVPRASVLADHAGIAYVIAGAPVSGLSTEDVLLLTKSVVAGGVPEASAWFGEALAAGDFNGDGFADLAISADLSTTPTGTAAGMVYVLAGSAEGLDTQSQLLHHDLAAPGSEQEGMRLGFVLVAADFNGDGVDDLAAGAPFLGANSGGADVFYGTASSIFCDGFESGDAAVWSSTVE